jgi:hypothetical protein
VHASQRAFDENAQADDGCDGAGHDRHDHHETFSHRVGALASTRTGDDGTSWQSGELGVKSAVAIACWTRVVAFECE